MPPTRPSQNPLDRLPGRLFGRLLDRLFDRLFDRPRRAEEIQPRPAADSVRVPAPLQTPLQARFDAMDRAARKAWFSRPLEAVSFAVLDTELTGLDPARDEIVSIGAVRIRGLRLDPQDGFYALVRPEADLPRISTLIHGLTPEALRAAPPVAEVLPGLLAWLDDALIVGHHVSLDMTFLNRALRRHFGAGLRTPCLDTLRLAQALQEDLWARRDDAYRLNTVYTLAGLAETYGLPRLPAHNAWADALETAYLFLFLTRKLRSGRLRTLRDLHEVARPRRFL